MSPLRRTLAGAVVGGWAVLLFCGNGFGQTGSDSAAPDVTSMRDQWEQRVLRRAGPPAYQQPPSRPGYALRWSPTRPSSTVSRVAGTSDFAEPQFVEPETAAGAGEISLEMIPPGQEIGLPPIEAPYEGSGTGGVCSDGCGAGGAACGDCWGGPWCGPPCGRPLCGGLVRGVLRHSSFFAGAHGFKGPADLGRNGNFGLHEGVNFSGPLGGPYGVGYQVGVQAVHSNFSGDHVSLVPRSGDRDQIFLTAGIFRRNMCRGLQGGIVFDLLHDTYHDTADFSQIRPEISLMLDGCRELGFWGAFATRRDQFLLEEPDFPQIARILAMEPTDLFAFFYRRQFSSGGEGRIFGGFSGRGDGLLGADCIVPLGRSWALENSFTYLSPKEGNGVAGQAEESWGLSIQLVWYPGRDARSVLSSPFRPLFSVADNSRFLLDRE